MQSSAPEHVKFRIRHREYTRPKQRWRISVPPFRADCPRPGPANPICMVSVNEQARFSHFFHDVANPLAA
jgi:hypothetical protein